jgi:hypothetical protein
LNASLEKNVDLGIEMDFIGQQVTNGTGSGPEHDNEEGRSAANTGGPDEVVEVVREDPIGSSRRVCCADR